MLYTILNIKTESACVQLDAFFQDNSPNMDENVNREKQVCPQTPTTFLWHTWGEATVSVKNWITIAVQWMQEL